MIASNVKPNSKGKGVASDVDPAKEWQTPNRKNKAKKVGKKQDSSVDSSYNAGLPTLRWP